MLVVAQWAGRRRDGLISPSTVYKGRGWMSGKQIEWCMISANVGVCNGECMGDKPLTMMRCHSSGLPQLYEALGWNSCMLPSLQLKGHIRENFFLFFSLELMHADPAVEGGASV